MHLKDLDYNLPKDLIASRPLRPRDKSRLLVYDRKTKKTLHLHFYRCVDWLKAGDILVLNDTKVLPARIRARKITPESGLGRVYKILLVKKIRPDTWECLIEGKKRRVGQELIFAKNLIGRIIDWRQGLWQIKFNQSGKVLDKKLFGLGEAPLPPYIKKNSNDQFPISKQGRKDTYKDYYQTVYAKKLGSVAAPTAGFHFTKKLLEKIKKKGIKILYLTLHVGPGTFLPITSEDLRKHQMHSEFFEIKKDVWNKILKAKKEKRRVVACGTTTTRVLEFLANRRHSRRERAGEKVIRGETNLFIYPPYKFKIVDALITNFHLPKTTLLALVAAFLVPGKMSGIRLVKKLYRLAISKKYRFYSFGDAMFIK